MANRGQRRINKNIENPSKLNQNKKSVHLNFGVDNEIVQQYQRQVHRNKKIFKRKYTRNLIIKLPTTTIRR